MLYTTEKIESAFAAADDALALVWDALADYEDGDGDAIITDTETMDAIFAISDALAALKARAINELNGNF